MGEEDEVRALIPAYAIAGSPDSAGLRYPGINPLVCDCRENSPVSEPAFSIRGSPSKKGITGCKHNLASVILHPKSYGFYSCARRRNTCGSASHSA